MTASSRRRLYGSPAHDSSHIEYRTGRGLPTVVSSRDPEPQIRSPAHQWRERVEDGLRRLDGHVEVGAWAKEQRLDPCSQSPDPGLTRLARPAPGL